MLLLMGGSGGDSGVGGEGVTSEEPEGWCCRMERRAAHVAALVFSEEGREERGEVGRRLAAGGGGVHVVG